MHQCLLFVPSGVGGRAAYREWRSAVAAGRERIRLNRDHHKTPVSVCSM